LYAPCSSHRNETLFGRLLRRAHYPRQCIDLTSTRDKVLSHRINRTTTMFRRKEHAK
jgi:hypothetical protein